MTHLATFRDLALIEPVLKTLEAVGYESPTPIQAATIPPLMAGLDVVGQAQTGTGKTAAFALPLLSRIDVRKMAPQALVLTPTRELAIQVAEAFQRYAGHIQNFHVLPIYGGQSYEPQLKALKRGVHVVVGTPGRVMDHMKRGTLKLDALAHLVLDEADEMLRMGFIEDVEWILQQTPPARQVALFSATMPMPIRRIAQTHLTAPVEITIKGKTSTAANIRQRYWMVSGLHKLDALTRILEAEPFDGMIVFTRTKIATEELAERLEARGYAAAALNGDMPQAQRERTVARLRDGSLDILVATDVAARGLDVQRVSHVFNYDIPTDTESYIHRIGRTGRAGRSGEAILFIAPRERHLLHSIERATRQTITPMELPSAERVNDQRIAKFKQRITDALALEELSLFQSLIEQYEREHNVPAVEIAAALARIAQGDTPLLLDVEPKEHRKERHHEPVTAAARPVHADVKKHPRAQAITGQGDTPFPRDVKAKGHRKERYSAPAAVAARPARAAGAKEYPPAQAIETRPVLPKLIIERPHKKARRAGAAEAGMETFRIEVGSEHGVQPGNIVGAIANEAGLDSQHIGRIEIRADHSLIDLPIGMPKEVLSHLKKVWVSGQALRISRAQEGGARPPASRPKKRLTLKRPAPSV